MGKTYDALGDTAPTGDGEGSPGLDFATGLSETYGATEVVEWTGPQGPCLSEVSRQGDLVRVSVDRGGVPWVLELDRAPAAKFGLALLLSASGLAGKPADLAALLDQLAVAAAGEPPDGERGGATLVAATPA